MDDLSYTPAAEGKPSLKDRILGMNKALLAIIGGALALVIVAVILITLLAGGGKTSSFSLLEKMYNGKITSYETAVVKLLNGADKNTVSNILKIMKKNDDFKEDYLESNEESLALMIERFEDEYGDDFKVRIRNERDSQEQIDEDDLDDYKDDLKELGKRYAALGKSLSSLKSSEKKDLAEDLDISVSDLNKLIGYIKDLGSVLKTAKVTDGYDLEAEMTITGSELDEPETEYENLTVLKVNGKWVSEFGYEALEDLYRTLYRFLG
ncbi:MAG: hypothetical protein IK149_07620 [Oscillospiraceae bacterium]|nr:hypothetical protein [Oscillospiraceae bacterium]